MALDGYNHFTMTKSLGVFFTSFVDVVMRVKPDWIILAGDRGEQLVGATVGSYTYTPVAHIQAGERSGNIDGTARHALTKLAHLHFAANEDATERLRRSGEEDFRIQYVGAPMLDELFQGMETSPEELSLKYNIDLSKPYFLVIQHPVTEEYNLAADQIKCTINALDTFDLQKIWILPNNDAGSHFVRQSILQKKHGNIYTFSNLKRQDYLGFMKNAACMVGNSSSSIIEAPVYKVPAVNIGRRQNQRIQGINTINCEFDESAIIGAINSALSPEFKTSLQSCYSPYGDGRASERILNVLLSTPRTDKLLSKQITY
ncbi:MAG: UDP-N-acetylglucosamine 2-epimerase [Patescibacteria group bacterium]